MLCGKKGASVVVYYNVLDILNTQRLAAQYYHGNLANILTALPSLCICLFPSGNIQFSQVFTGL